MTREVIFTNVIIFKNTVIPKLCVLNKVLIQQLSVETMSVYEGAGLG